MTKTTFTPTHGQIIKDRAYGYRWKDSSFELRMPNYDLMGPTNLLTTVEDLLKWEHNFDSKVVEGADTLIEMTVPTGIET